MKMLVKICLFFGLFFGLYIICYAKIKTPENGLFSIDVPQDWSWEDKESSANNKFRIIHIENPNKKITIHITVGPSPTYSPDKQKKILKINSDQLEEVTRLINKSGLEMVDSMNEKDTTIGGIYASQISFRAKQGRSLTFSSIINLFYKNHIVEILSNQPDKKSVEIDKILQSIRFN